MTLLLDKQLLEERDYWLRRLSGDIVPIGIAPDADRACVHSEGMGLLVVPLDKSLIHSLSALTKQSALLSYVVVMSAVTLTLYNYTSSPSVVVGSPALRPEDGSAGVENLVTLIAEIEDDSPIRQLLLAIRASLLEAYKHQNYPFVRVLQDIGAYKNAGSRSFFRLVVSSDELHPTVPADAGDAIVSLMNSPSGKSISIRYREDLYEPATIERFAGHIIQAMRAVTSSSIQNVSDIDIVSEEERHELVSNWSQGQAREDYSLDKSASDLFEEQVLQTPDALAVICEGEHLTYRQLNERANRVARWLLAHQIRSEMIVPILAERGISFLVAILAVFKTGAAYLPLDPKHPDGRTARIVQKSAAKLVLTTNKLTPRMDQICAAMEPNSNIIALNIEASEGIPEDSNNLGLHLRADQLAYVIFTSGSTGEPKGSMVEQIGMVNHLFALGEYVQLSNRDIVAQTASPCFDISVWQFITALIYGGTVHIFKDNVTQDPFALFENVDKYGLTIVQVVPSLIRALLDGIEDNSIQKPTLNRLRWISTTGEALSPELARRWFTHYPHHPLLNAYGPSECSDDVTFYALRESPAAHVVNMPIGKPILNMEVYVCDKHMRPVPVGVVGEIYVGGIGVGRGYLNDEKRTREAFIRHPFRSDDKARFYKTGDLGLFLADGNLEYCGRADYQVKIRGFRIELGEIEAQLVRLSFIKDAVVMAREDVGASKQLVAYLIHDQGQAMPSHVLATLLRESLPEYMIPTLFVWMDQFPLSANGKLDRKALPVPQMTIEEEGAYVAPQNEIEAALEAIWSEVLGASQISIYDNFFSLGGDSILSIQVAYKMKQAGYSLRLSQIMEHQTIQSLALAIHRTEHVPKQIQAEQGEVTGMVPLTPVQRWFFEENFADAHHWNQATYVAVHERLSLDLLRETLAHLMLHHDALRLRFISSPTQVEQQFSPWDKEDVPVHLIDLSAMEETALIRELEQRASELQASLNLTQGPLIRAAIVDLGEKKTNRVLIVVHHLVIDGVSWRILLEDLQNVYQAIKRGEQPRLLHKTSSYKLWAETLEDYVASGHVDNELDYWLHPSRPQYTPLPTDRVGDNTTASAATITVSLNATETQMLLQQVPSALHVHINDILLTAFTEAMCRFTNGNSLFINMEGHGREDLFDHIDLGRTIGWFTSEYPLVLTARSDASSTLNLRLIRQQLREVPNRGFGYALLRYLHPNVEIRQKLAALPKPEVSFNYLGQFDAGGTSSSMFSTANEPIGLKRSLRGQRTYVLDVNGAVSDNRLQFVWEFSRELHQRETIERVAGYFIDNLRQIIELSAPGKVEVPLTHMQQWFFAQEFAEQHHWNNAIMLQITERVQPAVMEEALRQMLIHHDAFRYRYRQQAGRWVQTDSGEVKEVPFSLYDFSNLAQAEQIAEVERTAEELQRALDLSEPLLRVALMNVGEDQPQRLFIVIHHLVVDHMSWNFLLEDLERLYKSIEQKRISGVPAKTSSYREWANRLFEHAQSTVLYKETKEWLSELKGGTASLPRDYPGGSNQENTLAEAQVSLSKEETERVFRLAREAQMHVTDILQTALAIMLCQWAHVQDVLIDQGVHGRPDWFEELDLTRTIGWFSTSFPTKLTIVQGQSHWETLVSVKGRLEQSRKYGYRAMLLTYLQQSESVREELAIIPTPAVAFDYDGPAVLTSGSTGQPESMWLKAAHESRGMVRSPISKRSFEIDIRSWIYEQKLEMSWQYSTSLHSCETMKQLTSTYVNILHKVMASIPSSTTPLR